MIGESDRDGVDSILRVATHRTVSKNSFTISLLVRARCGIGKLCHAYLPRTMVMIGGGMEKLSLKKRGGVRILRVCEGRSAL